MNKINIKEIFPEEALSILNQHSNSYLIDVRTIPEWSFVGIPSLSSYNKEVIFLSWQVYPDMSINPRFIEKLSEIIPNRDCHLLFLCRTGGRSHHAALAAMQFGYQNCYNIINGFEGDHDISGHRGNINGWKASNLPWEQS
jgi:rhodanese-related sulfurtransferase